MKHVDLIVATGGSAMVKVAYSSGTPAYGVGAGNSVVVVDETADLEDAAKKIFLGKVFDNATSCSSENSCVMQKTVFDKMVGIIQEPRRIPVQCGRESPTEGSNVAGWRSPEQRSGGAACLKDRQTGRNQRLGAG